MPSAHMMGHWRGGVADCVCNAVEDGLEVATNEIAHSQVRVRVEPYPFIIEMLTPITLRIDYRYRIFFPFLRDPPLVKLPIISFYQDNNKRNCNHVQDINQGRGMQCHHIAFQSTLDICTPRKNSNCVRPPILDSVHQVIETAQYRTISHQQSSSLLL